LIKRAGSSAKVARILLNCRAIGLAARGGSKHDPPRTRSRRKRTRMTKLAFWRLLGAAYRFTLAYPRRLAAAAAPWLVAASVPALLLQALPSRSGLAGAVLALAAALCSLAGLLGFAFRWQRQILAGETVGGLAALRVGRRERRFIGHALLVFVIVGAALLGAIVLFFLPLTLLLSVLHARSLSGMSGWLFQGVAAIACGTVFARLALALPAAALDESGDMLEIAWQRSRGNALGLFLGTVLSVLPFALLQQLVEAPFGRALAGHLTLQLALSALATILGYVALAVLTAFFCYAHRALAPGAAPRDGIASSGALPAR